jgi:uncharacterized protein with von Willebrand factor type A (vWA) domain
VTPDEPAPDPLRSLVGFTVVLRHAGLPVTTERVTAFLTAVDALGTGREQVYRAGLLTLCGDPDDLRRYERAFVDWFDGGCPRCCPPAPAGSPTVRWTARRCGRRRRARRCCGTTTWVS